MPYQSKKRVGYKCFCGEFVSWSAVASHHKSKTCKMKILDKLKAKGIKPVFIKKDNIPNREVIRWNRKYYYKGNIAPPIHYINGIGKMIGNKFYLPPPKVIGRNGVVTMASYQHLHKRYYRIKAYLYENGIDENNMSIADWKQLAIQMHGEGIHDKGGIKQKYRVCGQIRGPYNKTTRYSGENQKIEHEVVYKIDTSGNAIVSFD